MVDKIPSLYSCRKAVPERHRCVASPGTNLEGPRGLTEQGACGEHGEAGPVLSPRASPAPGPEAWEERTLLSGPVSSSFFDVLPLCVEGADEASGRR